MEQKTGIIYELRCKIDNQWHPFYVGQTNNPKRRIGEHRTDAKNADDTSTLVYRNIKAYLLANDIEWDMFEVEQYDENSPDDLEDEHIVRLLMTGAKLWNSKKGSPNWLAERQQAADDMQVRGITSYRKYKQILTLEEHNRKIAEQNEKRILEEQRQQALEEYRQRELTARELQREKIKQEMLAAAERARIDQLQMAAAKKKKEQEAQARWLAEAPAREAKIRAETERLQRLEAEREAEREAQEAERLQRRLQTEQRLQEHELFLERKAEQQIADLQRARQRIAKILEKP